MVVVGLDEVGRGCWAGPLVACAVILDKHIDGLRDSKLLSKRQRLYLAKNITSSAKATGLGWVRSDLIDKIGLTAATTLAMQRALDQIPLIYHEIIIDGNYNYLANERLARTLIKADQTVASVSAASIIAKVSRDSWMHTVAAKKYPKYGFEKHLGYGTVLHRQMLQAYGPCQLHRLSFKPVAQILQEFTS